MAVAPGSESLHYVKEFIKSYREELFNNLREIFLFATSRHRRGRPSHGLIKM